jgi:hypothetical protein
VCVRAAVALLGAAACASSSEPSTGAESFPADAYVRATSDAGALAIEVRTTPTQPPPRGTCTVQLTVAGAADGRPRDGLVLTVVPWMPSHGHGTSITPQVEPRGGGRYLVTNVSLYMPGDWELRTSIAGAATDRVVIPVSVP